MSTIRLLALDMDGTTLTSDKEITLLTKKWIQMAAASGITVMFATGRGEEQVDQFAEELELNMPKVLLNGSLILDQSGKVMARYFLEPDTVKHLYQLARDHGTHFWGYTLHGRRLQSEWDEAWLDEPWHKFGFRSDDPNVLKAIREDLSTYDSIEITSSYWDNLEINPLGVNKAMGVQKICDELGYTMNQVMAIGDSLNDFSLIKEAGLGIAMENAAPELKAIATGSTSSNNDHGVALAIQQYLFNK
ncbi:Cof-type HAD-IIB family hydrolase [Pullulanibacillus sp. KACC 23026]|uniref:Cof-type HAD-IIB family hydrolase n=1 Tax=Pullulanibacillus sp. KACC 23026 TaxID=3028315 RepID=UPI0023B1C88E|nr:Cof-type HAD-IIB family hydrolase [Pullulanibacillus sp. KACC 23026]WEG13186.1 Cof-type HAD-IIB family hydrolase [Pullulanibacillus sp. KACC 23026]